VNVSRAAASEPVLGVQDARVWLRASSEEEDVIQALIQAATDQVEENVCRTLVNRVVTYTLDAGEDRGPIWLPFGPVSAITSVTAYNSSDTSTAITDYVLVGDKLHEASGTEGWRVANGRAYRSLVIVYTAGYGSTAEDVPEGLRVAVKKLCRDLFELRSSEVSGSSVAEVSSNWEKLCAPYRQGNLSQWASG